MEIEQDDHKILCCLCQELIRPNPANMCINCIKSQVDITAEYSKEEIILFCRECERYLQPPKYWMQAELESRELLSLCLKKIKGLKKNDVKIVDAKFLWTEPHSRRLKVKVTIQKEVLNGTKIQQSFVITYIVKNLQCDTCKQSYTTRDWVATVQVRQKVGHKRTIYYLEQMIMKYDMHLNCINLNEETHGMDFFFNHRSHALKFKDFVTSMTPCTVETSKKLMTHDTKNNIYNYKYAFSIHIAPLCREDLVCLPPKIAQSMGGIGPLVLVYRVNSAIHFVDPQTTQRQQLQAKQYFKHPFDSFMNSRKMTTYYVMDVEIIERAHKKFWLAEVEIRRSLTDDTEDSIFVKSHLGKMLTPGDEVYGYDLEHENINDYNFDQRSMGGAKKRKRKVKEMPSVVLVKRKFEKATQRKFTLKPLNPELKRQNDDYTQFLEEIATDENMQKYVKMYKNKQYKKEEDTADEMINEENLIDEEEEQKQLEAEKIAIEQTLKVEEDEEDEEDDEIDETKDETKDEIKEEAKGETKGETIMEEFSDDEEDEE